MRTYEQQITAEFEQEIAERDKEIERLRADKERMDWLESWTKGDTAICPPGNHGGGANHWLIAREDDDKRDRWGSVSEESEGLTVRAAIDAARAASRDEERDR